LLMEVEAVDIVEEINTLLKYFRMKVSLLCLLTCSLQMYFHTLCR
jgi:hypothetical protein